jgi:hypothetical protein
MSTNERLTLMRWSSAAQFRQRAEAFLNQHEAVHCLPIGICSNLIAVAKAIDDVYLATIEQQGALVATAVRTPPWPVVLSLVLPEALAGNVLARLADDLHTTYGQLSGVNGPVPLSRQFAEVWSAIAGQPHRLGLQERIYQLETVQRIANVPGQLRRAVDADREVLVRWVDAFNQEALGEDYREDATIWVDNALASPTRGVFLWENREPVALVAYGGPTTHGMRIGPVYTPPEHRRRGYASAATAAVSQHLRDNGRRFCFLYTDLANQTANHIYQEIGYRPVCDVEVYRF